MLKREKNFNYFDAFYQMAEKSSEAAKKLVMILQDFNPADIEKHLEAMHEIEHNADLLHHELIRRLAREFITPIEREDIILMGSELDNVVDKIEDVVQRIYMYNIQDIPENALRITEKIASCCEMLIVSCSKFEHFVKNSKELKDAIIEINHLEEEADSLYLNGIRDLYVNEKDPIRVNAWEATYTRLEKCCDACEHVADVMESIIMKNT